MTWSQFSLSCDASELAQVENLLLELGALCLTLGDAGDEPIYEPLPGDNPVWQHSIVTATFPPDVDREALYRQLTGALPEHLVAGISQQLLPDQDWEQTYKQHFRPLQCAPDLWIVPSWSDPPDPKATIIRLDPGLAFGTGSHPTTALCLAWMGAADMRDRRVIDYGCGSGILAIAACKLGARHVTAVDIDTQALDACASNLQVNGIDASRIQISLPDAIDASGADILLANILARPLLGLAPRFAELVASGGQILLSGILKTQLEDIQLAYRPFFELEQIGFRDEWALVSGTRV